MNETHHTLPTRRAFLRWIAMSGTLALLPGVFIACEDSTNTEGISGPGSGSSLVIDFAKGDVAILQFAWLLEQLEADFYSQVVANFSGSDFTAADKLLLTDIRNHEVIHREFLKAALGSNATFTVGAIYPRLNFRDRATVLAAARTFEDLGVAAYNGAAQYLTDVNNLLVVGKIVSVEARHSAAVRDLLSPLSGDFAPASFDDAFKPAKVAGSAQGFIVNQLSFANPPTVFVQGPNANG